jgi:hypothetical protein
VFISSTPFCANKNDETRTKTTLSMATTTTSTMKEDPVDELLLLHSEDALVMDSMDVLHGVQEIVVSDPDMVPTVGLPMPGSRLGVLLWQGSSSVDESVRNMSEAVEREEGTMAGLFGE